VCVPETNYRILHDHWINGATFADIASTTGLPIERIRERHKRAMRKLRRIYGGLGGA
jgi:DNA-directed RNA polymerase sigma subunit (sigma70/sigma32)